MTLRARSLLVAVMTCAVGMMLVPVPVPGAEETFRVPVQPFAGEPRGPYETGTVEELWVNEALEDPSTSDPHDKRKVIVQAWYPASPSKNKNAQRASYAISPQLYGENHWVHELAHVQTQSVLDASPAPGRFPVLIYNHGGGNPHFSATFQSEFLASHGYVVVAIGHPGANGIERFTDRTPYSNDGARLLAKPDASQKLSWREREEYQFLHSDLGLYVRDISFVLDRLAAANADPKHRFHRILDLDRVGSFGWSLGGVISLQAARAEPRIKAAANLDGWPYGLLGPDGVVTLGSERPVLLMFCLPNSGGTLTASPWGTMDARGGMDAGQIEASLAAATYYWAMLRRSTANWYHVTLERAHHGYFSDEPLFEEHDPQYLHPRVAHAIVNGYTLEFFDKHVRGSAAASPLLSGMRSFPEATLLRHKSAPEQSLQHDSTHTTPLTK